MRGVHTHRRTSLPQRDESNVAAGFHSLHNAQYCEHEYNAVESIASDAVESYRYHRSIKSKMMLPFFVSRCWKF